MQPNRTFVKFLSASTVSLAIARELGSTDGSFVSTVIRAIFKIFIFKIKFQFFSFLLLVIENVVLIKIGCIAVIKLINLINYQLRKNIVQKVVNLFFIHIFCYKDEV